MKPFAALISICLALIVAESAEAQENFYRGKTLRIVVGFSAGGGFDVYSR
jgi:tripartite-type tricarboxylate transporter receptor subunit TctC